MSSTQYDILVLGKAGNGKSELCNTLVGEEKFTTGRSLSVTTTTATHHDIRHDGSDIRVIDTPDITNCDMDENQQRHELHHWRSLLHSPLPSLVLLAIRCDVRYTKEELDIYEHIMSLWSAPSLDQRLAIAFTFGENLDGDIKQVTRNPPPDLGKILRRADGRFMVFKNKSETDRQSQANRCFSMMSDLNPEAKEGCCHFM